MPPAEQQYTELAPDFCRWQGQRDDVSATRLLGAFSSLIIRAVQEHKPHPNQAGGAIDQDDLLQTARLKLLEEAARGGPNFGRTILSVLRRTASEEFHRHAYAARIPREAQSLVQAIIQDDEVPGDGTPYHRLRAVWQADSWEAAIEAEMAAADPYTGTPPEDEGSSWEGARLITGQPAKSDVAEGEPGIFVTKGPDRTGEPEAMVATMAMRAFLRRAFAPIRRPDGTVQQMLSLERQALWLRFGLDGKGERSPLEIAQQLGIVKKIRTAKPNANAKSIERLSKATVNQMIKGTLQHLRHLAAYGNYNFYSRDLYLD